VAPPSVGAGWELFFAARFLGHGRASHFRPLSPLPWPLWPVCLISLSVTGCFELSVCLSKAGCPLSKEQVQVLMQCTVSGQKCVASRDVRSRTFRIYVCSVYTVYTVCHFHAVSRVFRMSVDFLPVVHADCKLHRANRRRYQAAKQAQLNRM